MAIPWAMAAGSPIASRIATTSRSTAATKRRRAVLTGARRQTGRLGNRGRLLNDEVSPTRCSANDWLPPALRKSGEGRGARKIKIGKRFYESIFVRGLQAQSAQGDPSLRDTGR